jgi:hypothetical protein
MLAVQDSLAKLQEKNFTVNLMISALMQYGDIAGMEKPFLYWIACK